ncbi:hypothetical protein L218DRAFT_949386 [Marasmius fiardii PR-910]|nr:hypothetical protein L218DRAFT_949386 [Marasmius fiardii PR-910]
MAAADSFLRDVLAALRRVSEPPELKEISRLAISIHEQGRVFPWMSDLVKRSCEAAYLAQSANLRQREDLEQTLNDIDAFVAQSRDSRVSRVLARWFYGHQIKRYNESLRSFILQDFCEKVDQYGAPEVCTEKNPSQFVPLESPADRIDSGVQENHNTTAMGHEPTSSEKPHPTVGSRSSTMASSLDVGLGSNSSSSAATPPPRDRICSSPIPVGPEDTPSDPGSSQSFQCEGNEVDTMQARLDTPIGRDNRGRICLPSLDGYASEAVQEVADLIQEEIQTKAVADADYRKECTKHLKGLFKTHRVLPTSLFVNDVVRPKDKSQPVGGGGFSVF